MATTYSDTSVNSLVINKLTKAQYDALETKSETELYLVPDEIDNAPTSGSNNPVKSGGVYSALQGKQDVIDSSHKLSADLVDDTNTTNKFTNATEKQTWNGKQDTLVSGTNIKTINNQSLLGSGNITIDISGKEDVTTIVAPVNATDATLPITALTCEVGKYYRIDVAVDTLAVTLPAMTDLTTVRTVVIYLTGGTTPAVTISSTAPTGGSAPDVYYQDGYAIEAGKTYEVNCLWNGASWIVASVEIVVTNNGE